MANSDLILLEHHHQLVNAIAKTEGVPKQVKLLLVGIATFFNVKNQCAFPKRRQIAKVTGYCPNHITSLIRQAVELGYLKSESQFTQVEGEVSPRQTANRYEFVLEKFGLFYSKTKAMLNRNLRKKKKEKQKQEEAYIPMMDFVNQQFAEAQAHLSYEQLPEQSPPDN